MPASNRGYPASDVVTRYCNVVGFVSFAFMPLCYLLLFYSGEIACACGFMYCMTKPSGTLVPEDSFILVGSQICALSPFCVPGV